MKAAMREAAKKREMRLGDLQKIEQGVRRHFHDDITVVVVFLDSKLTDIDNHVSHCPSPISITAGSPTNI